MTRASICVLGGAVVLSASWGRPGGLYLVGCFLGGACIGSGVAQMYRAWQRERVL